MTGSPPPDGCGVAEVSLLVPMRMCMYTTGERSFYATLHSS